MRKLVLLDDREHCTRFYWYLRSKDIEVWMDEEDPASKTIWICDEKKTIIAKNYLQEFENNPNDPKFQSAASSAQKISKKKSQEKQKLQRNKTSSGSHSLLAEFPITIFITLSCLVIFYLQSQDNSNSIYRLLAYSVDPASLFVRNFSEILSGQIWRLFTPIFMHQDWLHLFFNVLWFFQLGRLVEENYSSTRLALICLFISVVSNSIFYIIAGPSFLGLSGVNYGLLAYLWCMSEYDPNSRGNIDSQTVLLFVVFYCVGLAMTLLGMRVANSIHGFGAFTGIILGLIHSKRKRSFFKHTLNNPDTRQKVTWTLGLLFAGIIVDYIIY